MSNSTPSDADLEFLEDRVADMLSVLAEVAAGNLDTRIDILETDPGPLLALTVGINETISSLADVHGQLQRRLQMIEEQQEAIRALSSPVLNVWDGVIAVPLIGTVDTSRFDHVMQSTLAAVNERDARAVIIDLTGIETMDTATAAALLQLSSSIRLLGARPLLTGVTAAIARILVNLGVNLDIDTRGTFMHGLQAAIRELGNDDGQ